MASGNLKIKLCGFTEELSLKAAIACKPDFIGFVFYEKSPRNLSLQKAQTLASLVPENIAKVAVIVDADINFLTQIKQALEPHYFQLHGNFTKEQIADIRKNFPQIKIIKAIKINSEDDLKQNLQFADDADFLLFDSSLGGSGVSFDWNILKNNQKLLAQKKWFLSGGLNINNIDEALKITGAQMIDISSGLEEERGKKSPALIKQFMKKIKNAN